MDDVWELMIMIYDFCDAGFGGEGACELDERESSEEELI